MDVFKIVTQHWVLTGITALIAYLLGSAIYNLYFSPLAKYPGPFFARISGIPNFYHNLTGYRHIWLWQCHQIYGEVFRYTPNGLLFDTPTAFRAIHETKANTKKALFYQMFPRNSRNWNTITVVDPQEHTRKRRVLNAAFSDKAVRSAETTISKNVDRWGELRVDGVKDWSEPEDMSVLSDQLAFDIAGELTFGKSLGIKEPEENLLKDMPHVVVGYLKYIYSLGHSPFLPPFVWLKPRGLDNLMERIVPPTVRKFYDFIELNVEQRRLEEESLEKKDIEKDERKKDLFHYIFKVRDENGNAAYSTDELHAEANLLVVAGSDTTATVLCGFWFYILRKEPCYKRLVEEIRGTFDIQDDIQGGAKLWSCTYLNACINETLRIVPVVPSEIPREVLPGGLDINGDCIPAGTQVGVTMWALNHQEEIFGDPWNFRPERWIEDFATGVTSEDVAHACASVFPFHLGSGSCAGKKIAMLELQLAIARTLWRFDVRLKPGDALGAGKKEFPWGMRRQDCFLDIRDHFAVKRDGPNVQFREKVV